jgi:hypothetical protein
MSNPQNKETQSTAVQPKQSVVPDGKSPLPRVNQDFPGDNPGGSGPSSGPAK